MPEGVRTPSNANWRRGSEGRLDCNPSQNSPELVHESDFDGTAESSDHAAPDHSPDWPALETGTFENLRVFGNNRSQGSVKRSSPFELETNAVAQRVLVAYCDISTAGIQNWSTRASQTKSSERRDKAGVPVGIATSPRQRP